MDFHQLLPEVRPGRVGRDRHPRQGRPNDTESRRKEEAGHQPRLVEPEDGTIDRSEVENEPSLCPVREGRPGRLAAFTESWTDFSVGTARQLYGEAEGGR